MKVGQKWIYEIYRNGCLHRSFAAEARAFEYLTVARELCPGEKWELVCVKVLSGREVSE